MNPVQKALWFIESHSAGDITLDDVAGCAGVSRFHLLRAFNAVTGLSIMRYLRGRRLSLAATQLAAGADDILSLAVEAGYASHEAFTRAFRDQFGVTPESVRKRGNVNNIRLVEEVGMNTIASVRIDAPRIERGSLLLIAGLHAHFNCEQSAGGIPALWQRFGPYIGHVPGQRGNVAYGVCYNTDDTGSMDYLCGVDVADFASLPAEFTCLRLPERRYAVFEHREHISSIRNTWSAIWNQWLPQSQHVVADAPFFERYGESFDAHSGNGGLELWVPLEK